MMIRKDSLVYNFKICVLSYITQNHNKVYTLPRVAACALNPSLPSFMRPLWEYRVPIGLLPPSPVLIGQSCLYMERQPDVTILGVRACKQYT